MKTIVFFTFGAKNKLARVQSDFPYDVPVELVATILKESFPKMAETIPVIKEGHAFAAKSNSVPPAPSEALFKKKENISVFPICSLFFGGNIAGASLF